MIKSKAKPASTIASTNPENALPPEAAKQKGELLICNLWMNGTDSVHNMRVENTDSKSHLGKQTEKCLQEIDRANNRIYLEACLQQRRNFPPFVASVDGLLGV